MNKIRHHTPISPVRAFLSAYGRLHKEADIYRPRLADNPDCFLNEAFCASGRNISVAASFLDDAIRREARIAYLACRALDAYEDLLPAPAESRKCVAHAAQYLTGRSVEPVTTSFVTPNSKSDAIEILIAQNLPLLKEEIQSLGDESRQRVETLIGDMANGMVRAITRRISGSPIDQAAYGEEILGKAIEYAFVLLKVKCHWPVDFISMGRLIQAANMLRDIERDSIARATDDIGDIAERRICFYLEVSETGAQIPRALASLRFPGISRPRASIAYMAATTATFFLKNSSAPCTVNLEAPLKIALLSALSPRYFSRFVATLEGLFLDVIGHLCARDGVMPESLWAQREKLDGALEKIQEQRNFEAALAARHPTLSHAKSLVYATQLIHTAIAMSAQIQNVPLTGGTKSDDSGSVILLTDYLLSRATLTLAPLGGDIFAHFGQLIAALSTNAIERNSSVDCHGEVAEFIARIVYKAQGQTGLELERQAKDCRAKIHWLYELAP